MQEHDIFDCSLTPSRSLSFKLSFTLSFTPRIRLPRLPKFKRKEYTRIGIWPNSTKPWQSVCHARSYPSSWVLSWGAPGEMKTLRLSTN